ncbi:MAG: hypothetical protein JSR90_05925 [Proteobacteria bacterium]|nr:hypothetical protein [Pseudomonadota bacterium]
MTLARKVEFLRRGEAYGDAGQSVESRETHMSWVFLVNGKVYKLKKPVRFPYLDFSSIEKRRAACASELLLNRRLAADVYEAVMPLTLLGDRLSVAGVGEIVDWLVVMRRLDESATLERRLLAGDLAPHALDPLIGTLARFYRRTARIALSPALLLSHWQRNLDDNARVLLDPRLPLPTATVRRIDRVQRRFLRRGAPLLAARARSHWIVDGHGDLRPEHIWLTPAVRIIDCLEFNRRLRMIDPLDEIAFLCVECTRLGGAHLAAYIKHRIARLLPSRIPEPLFAFYHCYRATLRARLAIAHLLEPAPRTPAKWPLLARTYLDLALADALRLERMMAQSGSLSGLPTRRRPCDA